MPDQLLHTLSTLGRISLDKFYSIYDEIQNEYVFRWEKIPGKDNGRLIEFLTQNFGIDWVKTANIEKIDNCKTIKISAEKNSLLLKLNDEKTEVIFEIDNIRAVNKFTAQKENDELSIYGNEMEKSIGKTQATTIRLLDALGHCEFDFEKRLVYACPPFLVALPSSGLPNAVLTGARTPTMINKIVEFIRRNKDSISYRFVKQGNNGYLLPSTVFIEAVDQSVLVSVAKAANIGQKLDVPAAWSFANFSKGIEDLKKSLFFEQKKDLTWYRETFSRDTFGFSKYNNKYPPQGLVWYTNPYNQQPYHLIWEAGRAARVDRYWGSYIILAEDNANVLLYDFRRNLLAVPSEVPLPLILGRAAALCSGLAPESIRLSEKLTGDLPGGLSMDVYGAVPLSIARLISEKLAQDIIPCEFRLD